MMMKPLETLLAIKVLGLVDGLCANDRRVAAVLIEHFNRKTNRCDPGLLRIAGLLGISERTVIRSVKRLERSGLFRKVRHGGYGNRNSYEPVWLLFERYEQSWRARFAPNKSSKVTGSSSKTRPACHLQDDSGVTQTYRTNNLHNETYSQGHPKNESKNTTTSASKNPQFGNRSMDAAMAQAERRWSNVLHEQFKAMPITYGELIEAITDDIRSAANAAEMQHRGDGVAYIFRQLKLGTPR
jgi:hypothetical protein